MISDTQLRRALYVVQKSGVAADLEARLRANPGGAPRTLSVELLFAACILVNGKEAASATLVQIHHLLTMRLTASTQFRLGLAWKEGTQVRKLEIHQVRYLFKRVRKLLDYSPHTARVWGSGKNRSVGRTLTEGERVEREEEFIDYLARLMHTSVEAAPPTPEHAIDASAIASPGAQRSHAKAEEGDDYRLDSSVFVKEPTRSSDKDARFGYSTPTQDKGNSDSIFGFQWLTSSSVYGRSSCEQPLKLITGSHLVPANAVLAGPMLRMLKGLVARQEVTQIFVDRGFSNSTAEHWADHLSALEIDQVIDLMDNQRGEYLDPKTGALMIDGWPCVPWTPPRLRKIAKPPRWIVDEPGPDADEEDLETYRRNLAALKEFHRLQAELAQYALAPNGRRLADGSRRFKTTRFGSQKATAAQRDAKVFTAVSITIEADVMPHIRQRLRWGSKEWIREFSQRNSVESGYGNVKTLDGEGVRRGWIRLTGLVATGLMLTFAAIHYNLRMLQKWARLNGREGEHPLLEAEPVILGYEPVQLAEFDDLAASVPPTTG